MKNFLLAFLALSVWSCTNSSNQDFTEKYKTEIRDTEKAFADMAREKSIPEAFIHFAADSVVIMRSDSLIRGKLGLVDYFKPQGFEGISLTWSAEFVDVSSSGDLGYTYGNYMYSVQDSTGKTTNYTGIFHTVWKKQSDGSWKFVWD